MLKASINLSWVKKVSLRQIFNKWRNEKNGRLKTLAKFDTIGLKEGFFKMDCKKEVKYAPSVKVYM